MRNQITFYIVLILTILVSLFERGYFQIGLMVILFISTGFLIKRKILFTGLAIIAILFLFVVKKNLDLNSGNDLKIKKFNFSIGDEEE